MAAGYNALTGVIGKLGKRRPPYASGVTKPRAEVLVSVNGSPEPVESVAAQLREAGIAVDVGRYEQRSAELPELIMLMILLKAAGIVGDEAIRQLVRDVIEAWKDARRSYTTQGSIEVPTHPPTEYNLERDVPDDALDLIEADMQIAEPGDSRYWHRTERQWIGLKELHRLDWEVEVVDDSVTANHQHLYGPVNAEIRKNADGVAFAVFRAAGHSGQSATSVDEQVSIR